ncbi:hypothetical protein BN14_07906 [Rhizoctonia solani AG-1 IB]|nr:hypothetical protein BN14_07906 [Rhizoctonia solani AG-1 IB]
MSIRAPPEGLPSDLQVAMKAVNINDPSSPIPSLELIRKDPVTEARLEREIFALSDGRRLLSDKEVAERRDELDHLRRGRRLATLINGNHRMNAMIAASKPLADAALHIATCERQKVDGFDAKAEWQRLKESLKAATYVVQVFDYNTPPHVLLWLSENERTRPQYAPLAGEAMWSLVESQETLAGVMISKGQATDRMHAIAQINGLRDREKKSKGLSPAETELLKRLANLPMNRRGTSLGDKECIALMSYPTTMEMVCDTRMGLCVYSDRINNTHAKAMLSERGAGLTAFTWLGTRLLLKLTNTTHGVGLKELTGPSKIRSSLTRPRSGLKLQDPPSSQAPALHCSSIGSPAPALGNSQPFEEPPFPFAQAPSRPRSTTPGTPEQTQLPSDDEASADEFDMRDYLPPKGVKGSHKYQLDEDDSDSSSKDSGDVDTDPYHGLGKRERHKLIELSPPVARKSSRL